MSRRQLLVAALVAVCATLAAAAGPVAPIVVSGFPNGTVVPGVWASACARAYYTRTLNVTGWNTLKVVTSSSCSDRDQMYSAGLVEGFVSQLDIQNFLSNWLNTQTPLSARTDVDPLTKWLMANIVWLESQIAANPHDVWWAQLGLQLQQLAGELDGYNLAASPNEQLQLIDMYSLSAGGDIVTLVTALNLTDALGFPNPRNWRNLTHQQFELMRAKTEHCSVLIRITNDNSEVFASHVTWGTWNILVRTWKRYEFYLSSASGTAAQAVTFSSYPGVLLSIDDYYTTSQRLLVTETTLGIFNNSLYELLTPASVLSWLRINVANRMASTGPQWVQLFAREHSGTYDNQWMVFDYKLFTPGQPLPANALWIIEESPGLCISEDVTPILSLGMWPSYNVPWAPAMWERLGFGMASAWFNTTAYSHAMAPRGQLFRREGVNVKCIDDMKFVMQYNNFLNTSDPLSPDACSAISCRGDLLPGENRSAFGGQDVKLTSSVLIGDVVGAGAALAAWAIDGPSTQQGLPPFQTAEFADQTFTGMPAVYEFDWQLIDLSGG